MTGGPERLDRFMARANAAYYATHDPFADFTTAPEITQAFGEVIGAWAAVVWAQMGAPAPVLLAEAGPGRGTLMADALRAVGQAAPAFRAALRVHLIETSPRLRAIQAKAVPGATWHARFEDLPPGPLVLVGNEFLDALPIRQFVWRGGGWLERYVEDGSFSEFPLPLGKGAEGGVPGAAALGPLPLTPSSKGRGDSDEEGTVIEHSQAAHAFVGALAARLTAAPGGALFLDYGPTTSTYGDSLQALRDGRPADPLAAPGSADLTAHVDFAGLAATARAAGAAIHGPIPQGVFLTRLGLMQRTDRLARARPPGKALALIAAARRLVEPHRMGRLFKAMALTSPDTPVPPGFEEDP